MHSEGGQAMSRDRRSRKLAVVVMVQNVLVASCLIVTLIVYREFQERVSSLVVGDNVHIQVEAFQGDSQSGGTLKLSHVYSFFMMGLQNDRIEVNCTGPYLAFLDVCYKNLDGFNSTAVLQLELRGGNAPLSSFMLQASHEACRGLHNVIYLRAGQEVSVRLKRDDNFKMINMTVGLNYLLGRGCDF